MNPVSAPATSALAELAARYGDAWNAQDVDAILSMHTQDTVFQLHTAGEPVEGAEAVRAVFAAFISQFPDITFEERALRFGEDFWVLESIMSGTLAVDLPLPFGDAVGRAGSRIQIDAVDVITVRDGKVATKHTYLDDMALLGQLGVTA